MCKAPGGRGPARPDLLNFGAALEWARSCKDGAVDVFQLVSNHVWKAAPGCRILVVDNGGVRCDIPREWIVYSPNRHVFVIDRFPPDNRCMVAISCRRVSSDVMAISLLWILEEWIAGEDRQVLDRSEPFRFHRWPMEAAWLQLRVIDPKSRRERVTRVCVARADRTQALIVLDFEPEDELSMNRAWNTLIDTLAVGDYIEDPGTGRKRIKRG
jgi:hypothetical protein